MKYKVMGNLGHDDVTYAAGDTIELESDTAKYLLEIGVIEKIKEEKVQEIKPKITKKVKIKSKRKGK